MKAFKFMLSLVFSLLVAVSFTINSCSDYEDEDDYPMNNTVQIPAVTLSGAQEVPANNSPGTGTFSGTYNKDTNVLSYTLTFSGLTSATTMAHFHKGDVGVSGPPVVNIKETQFSSPVTDQATLTEAQEADLLGGKWYVNVHTTTYPAGEIRAQLMKSGSGSTTGSTTY